MMNYRHYTYLSNIIILFFQNFSLSFTLRDNEVYINQKETDYSMTSNIESYVNILDILYNRIYLIHKKKLVLDVKYLTNFSSYMCDRVQKYKGIDRTKW